MDGYKVLEILYFGDNSDVFLALRVEDKRVCVLKKIKNGSVLPYEYLLGHDNPNLIKIFDVSEEENTVATEYVQGVPLSQCNRDVTEACVTERILQLCNAVLELHNNKIIHKDIKPENIMLTENNTVKLMDFDIAHIQKAHKSKDARVLGTEGYAPPEQYGFAQTDFRTDIYAIGAVIKDQIAGLSSTKLNMIADKCMQLDPYNRYQTVQELKSALMSNNFSMPSYEKSQSVLENKNTYENLGTKNKKINFQKLF